MWLILLISLIGIISIGIIMAYAFNKKFGFKQRVITYDHPPKTMDMRQHLDGKTNLDGSVHDSLNNIPSEPYRMGVDCLITNGLDNHLNTNYVPNKTDIIEIYAKFNDLSGGFCGTTSNSMDRFYFGIDLGKWQIGYGSSYDRPNDADTDWHMFKLDNGVLYVDDVEVGNASTGTWAGSSDFSFILGAQKYGMGIVNYANMIIKSFKVNGEYIFAFEERSGGISYHLNSGTNGSYETPEGNGLNMHALTDAQYSRNADKGFTKSGDVHIPAKNGSSIYDVQGNRLTNPPDCVHNNWGGDISQVDDTNFLDAVIITIDGINHVLTCEIDELEHQSPVYSKRSTTGDPDEFGNMPLLFKLSSKFNEEPYSWWQLDDEENSVYYTIARTRLNGFEFPVIGLYSNSGGDVISVNYESVWIQNGQLTPLSYSNYLALYSGKNSNAIKWITNPITSECFVKEHATYNQDTMNEFDLGELNTLKTFHGETSCGKFPDFVIHDGKYVIEDGQYVMYSGTI